MTLCTMGFYDDMFDAAAGPNVLKHLHNGVWRCSASGNLTSIGNPSKGGTAFKVQGTSIARTVCGRSRTASGCVVARHFLISNRQFGTPNCSLTAAFVPSPGCTIADVDAAYEGAHAAQVSWAQTPLHKRCAFLHSVAQRMRDNAQPIAACLVAEIAKPVKDALAEVVRVLGADTGRAAALALLVARSPLNALRWFPVLGTPPPRGCFRLTPAPGTASRCGLRT